MRLAIFTTAAVLLATTAQPFAMGADDGASAGTKTALADDGAKADSTSSEHMSLDNIQDVAYTLQRIDQQAINVYLEATRKKVDRYELKVPSLSSMPTAPLEEQSAYLRLRKGWLAFFIGTMEPLMQILKDHLKGLDERTEKSGLPSQYHAEWKTIVDEWASAIRDLNAQLDIIAALIDDPGAGNIEVAKAARAIDGQVSTMEKILQKASKFLHERVKE